ncbi:hypothetical protein FBZ94_11352 [Bradyrhizobium sacchari]|uniref:Uncharacterized protein n=1 Tax=Bradyrhizobium sacchari TaxID=1399419 RepID=A0A560HWL0_9BRAD|nr:hypothetical protein FBZ94_11352 [Bradyrhizobium sacchari]TWB68150.1 hypothetical protein FBZ95_11252 [Bradyrhizobium sacchari]
MATSAGAPNTATLRRAHSLLNCTEVKGLYPKDSTAYTKVSGRTGNV